MKGPDEAWSIVSCLILNLVIIDRDIYNVWFGSTYINNYFYNKIWRKINLYNKSLSQKKLFYLRREKNGFDAWC